MRWMVIASSLMPSVLATISARSAGVWVGAQQLELAVGEVAVQFCGSSAAWTMNGYA